MKVHLQVEGSPTLAGASARAIATLGADGAFSFEGPHDVFVPLVLAATESGLEIMTNVAVAGPRSPLHLAHTAYDLQLLSAGRFRLGLGSQIRVHIEKRYGSRWEKPARRTGESVAAVKAILAAWEGRAPLEFRGEFFTHTLMPPTFDPGPNPYGPPPVLMGGLGPVMTRTAAEVADGLLVMPFNTATHFAQRTLPALHRGLANAGREPGDVAVVAQAMVALGRTDAEVAAAVDAVGRLIAFYASTPAYRPVLDAEGWGEIQPTLNALSKQGRYAEMRALITEPMVRTIALVGTPAECAEQARERFGGHAADICCYFPHYEPAPDAVADLVALLQVLP